MSLLVFLEKFGTGIFELSSSDSKKIHDEKKQEMLKKTRNDSHLKHAESILIYISWNN